MKERGGDGGGGLIEGGDHFKYFQRRGAIIQGKRLIEGWLLFEQIRYFFIRIALLAPF